MTIEQEAREITTAILGKYSSMSAHEDYKWLNCFNAIEKALQAKQDRIEVLEGALRELLEACYIADSEEELSEYVDGSLLDQAKKALGGEA